MALRCAAGKARRRTALLGVERQAWSGLARTGKSGSGEAGAADEVDSVIVCA